MLAERSTHFLGQFFRRGRFSDAYSFQSWGATCIKYEKEIDQSLVLTMHLSEFRYVAPFRNSSDWGQRLRANGKLFTSLQNFLEMWAKYLTEAHHCARDANFRFSMTYNVPLFRNWSALWGLKSRPLLNVSICVN